MARFKAIILDLDGTTVVSQREAMPSQRVIDAVHAAREKVVVAVATGRSLSGAKNILQALGIEETCVFNGGSQIINVRSQEELYLRELAVETMHRIFEICQPFGYTMYNASGDSDEATVTSTAQLTKKSTMLMLEAVSPEDMIALIEELGAIDGIAAHPTSSWVSLSANDLHITHHEATKKHGVELLLEMLGVQKAATIGIGDSHNDLPLLMATGFKVAMGNAPDEVKAQADYVVASVYEDGVAEMIETFILR